MALNSAWSFVALDTMDNEVGVRHPASSVPSSFDGTTRCLETILFDDRLEADFGFDKAFDDVMTSQVTVESSDYLGTTTATMSIPATVSQVTQAPTMGAISPVSNASSVFPLENEAPLPPTFFAIATAACQSTAVPGPLLVHGSRDVAVSQDPEKHWFSPGTVPTSGAPYVRIGTKATVAQSVASSCNSIDQDESSAVRKERNRLHAQASRKRRKDFTTDLKHAAASLRDENAKLRSLLIKKLPSSHIMIRDRVAEELSKPTQRFLEQLQSNLKHRKVNQKTLRRLKALRKNLHVTAQGTKETPESFAMASSAGQNGSKRNDSTVKFLGRLGSLPIDCMKIWNVDA